MSAPALESAAPRTWSHAFQVYALRLENVLTALVIIMFANAGLMFLGVSEDYLLPKNDSLRLLWPPVYAIVLALSLARWRLISRYWIAIVCSLALVGWAGASVTWSIDPETTSRRVMALGFTTLFGLYLAASFDGRRFTRLMAVCFAIFAVGSLILCVAMPAYGVHQTGPLVGNWRGLFVTKNTLALMMAIGCVSCIALMITERRSMPLWWGVFALCFFLLIMAKSATSLLCCLVACTLAGIFLLMRRGALWRGIAIWGASAIAILGGAIIATERDAFLKMLGKDPTLTGRTEIWQAVFRQVEQSPWLGFGFAAFWAKGSAPAQWIKAQTQWAVPSAHNGWLDLIVQLGWIGAFLFGGVFLIACIGAILRITRLKDGYLSLLILAIFTIRALSESVILQHNNLEWALFIVALARTTGPLAPDREAMARA